jgi:hypothetical protein
LRRKEKPNGVEKTIGPKKKKKKGKPTIRHQAAI